MNQAIDLKSRFLHEWRKRSWWLNVILIFCLYMTFIYSPFDLLWKPMDQDEDVWFGVLFYGWQARVGGVIHLLVYAALSWGIWHMRGWAWWLGSLYATQVAIAMFLWPILNADAGLTGGLIAGGVFAVPAVALWLSRSKFEVPPTA